MAHYYDLGVALGWSLRQLDIIQYKAKRKLETASQETVAPKDAIQTSAGATMIGRRVRPTGPLSYGTDEDNMGVSSGGFEAGTRYKSGLI